MTTTPDPFTNDPARAAQGTPPMPTQPADEQTTDIIPTDTDAPSADQTTTERFATYQAQVPQTQPRPQDQAAQSQGVSWRPQPSSQVPQSAASAEASPSAPLPASQAAPAPVPHPAPEPVPFYGQPMSYEAPVAGQAAQPAPRPYDAAPVPQSQPVAYQPGPGAPFAAAAQPPYGEHAPSAPHPVAGGTIPPTVPPAFLAQSPEPPAKKGRKSRIGLAVVSTAVVTALVASGATAFAVTQVMDGRTSAQDGSTSLSQLGAAPEAGSGSSTSSITAPNWEAVASAVRDTVVAIDVSSSQAEGEGSGVIIDAKGHVLTNNHVVSLGNDIEVTLTNGTVYKAKVVGTDATTDLAVIQIQDPPANLKAASLGDSSSVKVGQNVMAIGNPLGLDNTVTSGIVSAVNRPVTTTASDSSQFSSSNASQVVTNAIQVDAAINPGNSGGPLFDGSGKVIGINSSIASLASGYSSDSSESGSIGLGFAIPINLAKNIASQLIESGSAQHAYLGVTLTDTTATVDGVTRQGAKVASVSSGTPAATAGLKQGDVIVGINDNAVSGATSLTAFVRSYAVGDQVKLTVVRGGKALDLTVTLAKAPASLTSGQDNQNQQGQDNQQGQGDGQGDGGQGDGGQGDGGQGSNPFDPFGMFGNGN